ncbi:malectin domain-containing carbohydrate-binding protein [Mangrovimonas cancribranchiae]|uniref:Malectin domain-containing carbohydrate-binding protein n=1 Tax=Mangrovimonas cancribranchiae TaxID=3080055 RepID=A0AAU6P1C8_9FLAO
MKPLSYNKILTATCLTFVLSFFSHAQTISFSSSGLVNGNILNPTSLQFGPDNRLYVAQQNGTIWAYTIERDAASQGNGTYTATAIEEINHIKIGVPNHDDLGNFNPSQQRLITGILVKGTPTNPIIYVTSSDYLLGGGSAGNDTNLDTNSSTISKLEWDGSAWAKVDLVRGLPRCEENHAINGMQMFERNGNTYLLVAQGGQTNKGAPSNNFAATPEYFFSGSMLIVDITQLENMPIYNDPRTNTDYIYDLPTLNDPSPSRPDIDNTHPEFPYPVGHPMYNATIDLGDPFGGNNSLNQAIPEPGGPVQVFAPGFRNAYDVLVTENGRIYTSDNGPNSLWGGLPKIYDINTDVFLGDQSTITYDPNNHYITNELNESGSSLVGDPLHYVGTINDSNGTYYGGHPIPILAFPSRAKVIAYENSGGSWIPIETHDLEELISGISGYFNTDFLITDFPDQPHIGEYLLDEPVGSPKVNILDVINSSTNGIAEYTASNFGGAMQGNILTASFNGDINRYVLNATGDTVLEYEATFNGFGSIPLDVIAQSDNDIFPGTVWAATYGSNSITVFEPAEIECYQPNDPEYNASADYDNDGYSNQDEIDNGSNICSQSSKPKDFDGDFISDLNDDDDDNDGILDVNDPFPIDPDNGMNTTLPINRPFWNNDPGTGFFGLGFTGLMLNPTGATDYLTQFNENDMSFGGAAGKATVDSVSGGDALENLNSQEYGFQFGFNTSNLTNSFTIHTKVESPFFGSGGSQNDPVDFQSYGIQFGTGDQDNYLKIVIMTGTSNADTEHGIQVLLEDNGVVTSDTKYDITDMLLSGSVYLYASIDPILQTAQPYYSIDGGNTLTLLGSPMTLPASFFDVSDNIGMAVGLISTSRSSTTPNPFTATWDYIEVYENQDGLLTTSPETVDFGLTPVLNTQRTKSVTITNAGGPTDSAITITQLNFSGDDATLFSSDISLPLNIPPSASIDIPIDFSSDGLIGIKNAQLEIVHSGTSTTLVNLIGHLTDIYSPLVRINCGGPEVLSTDNGPNWEDNTTIVGASFVVNRGTSYSISSIDPAFKDPSIPNYISNSEYNDVMRYELSNSDPEELMTYSITLPNGDYIVNLYFTNLYNGTPNPGERIEHVDIEGVRQIESLDPVGEFGHRIAGMVQRNVSLNDGVLDISFVHELQNPLVNAIEILAVTYPEIEIEPISDVTSCELEVSDFQAEASGGNPLDNITYSISGQPLGTDIEPTNGLIFGQIDESAVNGGPNSDGVYIVTVTASKPGSLSKSRSFTWTILDDTEAPIITCPEAIIEQVVSGTTETNVNIITPTATDNCSTEITYTGIRSDGMSLNDLYPLGDTTITWTATDASGNTSVSCDQLITVEVGFYTVDLIVSLQGRTDYSGNYNIVIYDINDLVTPIITETETADTAGNILLSSTLESGSYKILVKHPMFLQRALSVTISENINETVPLLLAGDVNNDNIVDIFDFGVLSGTFGLIEGDLDYNSSADFNGDAGVFINDFGLLSGNFSVAGEDQNN